MAVTPGFSECITKKQPNGRSDVQQWQKEYDIVFFAHNMKNSKTYYKEKNLKYINMMIEKINMIIDNGKGKKSTEVIMKNRIRKDLINLMQLPGLSGYEDRVRKDLNQKLKDIGVATSTDRLGNLLATFPGEGPSIMLFTHMDQLGFIIRKIEVDGLLRIERLGGVPERALASQKVLIPIESGTDIPGVIANKSHHATSLDENYTVLPYKDLFIVKDFVENIIQFIDLATDCAFMNLKSDKGPSINGSNILPPSSINETSILKFSLALVPSRWLG